jgi:RNA polymerase sigma-70 factor, ECF subfamily
MVPLPDVEAADAELARRAQEGDTDAFTALVERHWSRLVRFSRSVVGAGEAEDVVQESLVVAWERIGSLRDPTAFPGWVLRIVGRRAVRAARRWSWRRLLPVADLGDRADPAAGLDAERREVERVLGRLAPRQRAVMHLTVVEGMSDGEIAEVLAMDAATARSHRRKARTALRRILGVGPEGEDA